MPQKIHHCHLCGERIDQDGNGVCDDQGNWAHEECQDAADEYEQNEPDTDTIDYECYSDADPGL